MFNWNVAGSRSVTVQDMEKKEDDQELPESLQLHQTVVRKIGEICRMVNQVSEKKQRSKRTSCPLM